MSKKSCQRKDPILVEFAKRVRARRFMLELTQERLAEKGGFHVNFIGGIERATRNPSLTSIIKLANALETAPGDLIP